MDEQPKIEVSLSFEEGITEKLLVTPLGTDLYRLEETPIGGDANYLDVVEVVPGPGANGGANDTLKVVAVRQRSPLKRYDWLLSKEFSESDQLQKFLSRVKGEGGTWETIFGGQLIVYLPPESQFDPTNEFVRIVVKM